MPTLYRLKGIERPLPFVEDIAVPPERLPEFLVRLQNVLKTHQVTASLFAHAGHGKLHVRPFLDLADRDDVRKMQGWPRTSTGRCSTWAGRSAARTATA